MSLFKIADGPFYEYLAVTIEAAIDSEEMNTVVAQHVANGWEAHKRVSSQVIFRRPVNYQKPNHAQTATPDFT